MQLLPQPARRRGLSSRVFAVTPLVAVTFLLLFTAGAFENIAVGQPVPVLPNGRGESRVPTDQDVISGVYLPTDRTLSRASGVA